MQRACGFRIAPNPDSDSKFRFTFYVNPPPIRVISFKGGGARVIVYTKFVEIAHERGLLENVEEIGGSSSGCIASAFAAIHYEDPKKRTEVLDEISRLKKEDVFGRTKGWKAYRVLSAPLYLISKPFEWSADGVNWAADKLNQKSIGKLIGYPLKIFAVLFRAVSIIFSPKSYAAITNLIAGRGVYRGDVYQYHVRDQIQKDTQAGLDAILGKLTLKQRAEIGHDLVKKGVCTLENGSLKVVRDVTFKHLYELSKLPGSQFKQYYTTGFRMRDKQMVVFSKDTTPDMPIHLAMRIAVTFPFYFKTKKYDGDKFLDGGIIDNSPVRLASKKKLPVFMRKFGLKDKMARLNVRVEYPEEQEFHIWKKRPDDTGKFLYKVKHAIARFAAGGVDVFETNDETTKALQDHYSQRTLQIPDFGIGQLAKKISSEQRSLIDEELPKIYDEYFQNHAGEKAVIENYNSIEQIPQGERVTLLNLLTDETVENDEIFKIPDLSQDDLSALRSQLIEQVKQSFDLFKDEFSDTTGILRMLGIKPTFMPKMSGNDEFGMVEVVSITNKNNEEKTAENSANNTMRL